MKSEKELLKLFHSVGINSYQVDNETEIVKSIQLMNIEDLIDFACKNNIQTMFYNYNFIDEEMLKITDETISNLRLNEDCLSVLQEKFQQYNESLIQLDSTNPVLLNVYCIYQGIIVFIQEDDYWFIEQGFDFPENVCMELANKYFEDIEIEAENRKERIQEGREKLHHQILSDEEFQKCTNIQLRKSYAKKTIHKQ